MGPPGLRHLRVPGHEPRTVPVDGGGRGGVEEVPAAVLALARPHLDPIVVAAGGQVPQRRPYDPRRHADGAQRIRDEDGAPGAGRVAGHQGLADGGHDGRRAIGLEDDGRAVGVRGHHPGRGAELVPDARHYGLGDPAQRGGALGVLGQDLVVLAL